MQTLELNHCDLVEMDSTEMKNVNGGIAWLTPAIAITVILSAVNNFGDIRQGFSDGFNGRPPRHQ